MTALTASLARTATARREARAAKANRPRLATSIVVTDKEIEVDGKPFPWLIAEDGPVAHHLGAPGWASVDLTILVDGEVRFA